MFSHSETYNGIKATVHFFHKSIFLEDLEAGNWTQFSLSEYEKFNGNMQDFINENKWQINLY